MPNSPPGIAWRPLAETDLDALTSLQERMSVRDHPEWSESRDENREELAHSWVDPATDGIVALDADGVLVAYGLVVAPPNPENVQRVFLFGGVDPSARGRGIGRVLLEWQHARARQKLAASALTIPAWVLSQSPDRAPEHGALLERAGFTAVRYFTTLESDLSVPRATRPTPEGIAVEPFTAARSEAVRAAKNAAFADHWGSQPSGREQWESTQSLESFRPEFARVALDGDAVVGFVLVEMNEEDWERLGASSGYIPLVGTVRAWRRRGLAAALLDQVMEALHAAGIQRAVLDVDTENPTGALGLYTDLGFAQTARDVSYRVVY